MDDPKHLEPEIVQYKDGSTFYYYSYHHLRMKFIQDEINHCSREKFGTTTTAHGAAPTQARFDT